MKPTFDTSRLLKPGANSAPQLREESEPCPNANSLCHMCRHAFIQYTPTEQAWRGIKHQITCTHPALGEHSRDMIGVAQCNGLDAGSFSGAPLEVRKALDSKKQAELDAALDALEAEGKGMDQEEDPEPGDEDELEKALNAEDEDDEDDKDADGLDPDAKADLEEAKKQIAGAKGDESDLEKALDDEGEEEEEDSDEDPEEEEEAAAPAPVGPGASKDDE